MYLHELIDLLSNIHVDDDKEVEVFIESASGKHLVNNIFLETHTRFNYFDDSSEITRTIIIKK
jgi:hypothetical protein